MLFNEARMPKPRPKRRVQNRTLQGAHQSYELATKSTPLVYCCGACGETQTELIGL